MSDEDVIQIGYDSYEKYTPSDLKKHVDSKIRERKDLSTIPNYRDNRDLMTRIIDNRKRDFWHTKQVDDDYQSLMSQARDIQLGNEEIEQRVKMELMGIDSNPFRKFLYQVMTFFHKVFHKEPPESAQDLMQRQLRRVDSVSRGLGYASRIIDEKVNKLDRYYDNLLSKLESGVSYREDLMNGIEETEILMNQTQEVLENTDDYVEKIKYKTALRKMRKSIQNKAWELKATDREILDIDSEVPFIESFDDFCQTYSYALRESYQRVQRVKEHLSNVMGLYIEMMRTNHIDYALTETVDQLLIYTNNMSDSLLRASKLVEGVNQSELHSYGYERNRENLESVVDNVFESNARAFRDLEGRVNHLLES